MSTRAALNRVCKFILLAICLTFFADLVPIVAKGDPALLQQNRTPTATKTATRTATPTPTRSGPFVATPDGPLIFDFPTPRAVGSPGPIAGQELSALEKSALAVVKLNGCSKAAATACTASDGSGIIIHPRGLILTALHVVIEESGDLRSPLLPEVSVGIVEDPDEPVQSAYRATVAAIDSELDLALLRIILPADESEPFFPTLPIEKIGNRAFRTGTLRVMGFLQGQTRLKQPSVDFFGLNEDNAVEVEGSLVGRGFSGGPLLVEGEDRYHVGGVVFFRTDGPVLVQPMRLLTSLRWRDPEAPRLWIDSVQIEPTAAGGLSGLRLAANVHAVDLAERRLRLVATAFDPELDQPWPSADEPLVLRRTFEPARFVDVLPLALEASLMGLGSLPERLRFALQLWDVDESRLLWDGEVHYLATASTPTATATHTPTKTATRTPFPRPSTATPTPTKSTPSAAATVQAAVGATRTAEAVALTVQQSINATLTALAPTRTSTPTRPRATPPSASAPVDEAPAEEAAVKEAAADEASADEGATLGTADNPLIMSFVPSGGTEEIIASGDAIEKMLEEATGLEIESNVVTSFAAVVEAMGVGNAHIGWLNTFTYLLANKKYGVEPVMVTVRFGSSSYKGQIVTHADSGITELADLVGKTMCWVAPFSASGYIIPRVELQAAGIDPDNDFEKTIEAGSHNNVIIAVYNGECDAGATYDDARSSVEKDLADVKEQVVVIATSPDIPNDNVSVIAGMPAEMKTQIQDALLEIAASEAGQEALNTVYSIESLEVTDDSFYDGFRVQLEAAGISIEELAE